VQENRKMDRKMAVTKKFFISNQDESVYLKRG
jgi:hypothetical protein